MEFVGLLAPIAFVFAITALTKINKLEKEVNKLKEGLRKNEQNN